MSPIQTKSSFFARRRRLGLFLLALAVLAVWLVAQWQDANLGQSAYSTGYVLMGCLVFLAAYNLRKKIAFLPCLGSSRLWMQLHIYIGFFTVAVFLIHIGWHFPSGTFERFLAALYVIVAGSGMYGLYLTRTAPQKLTAVGHEVVFEQIPLLRRRLVDQARQLILDSASTSEVLAKFYVNRLAPFLERPCSLGYLLVPTSRHSKQLIADIRDLDRYLSAAQRKAGRDLAGLVKRKDDLDYHYALQGRLKIWLFVHIGLTYGLLITAVLHGVMTHAFAGGMR